jgi:hypothetical protein
MVWIERERLRVAEAEAEARRFLKRVEQWKAAHKEPGTHPIESGAMKRASMDLSRALTVLRRGETYQ